MLIFVLSRTINPNQLGIYFRYILTNIVYSVCLSAKIRIEGADENSGVIIVCIVKSFEIFSVDCQNRSAEFGGAFQNFVVGNFLIGSIVFKSGQNIVSETAQFNNDGECEIFISVKSH